MPPAPPESPPTGPDPVDVVQATAKDEGLTFRETLFCLGMVSHGQARRALDDAGYAQGNARSYVYELLHKPKIARVIDAGRTVIMRRYHLRTERIAEEMAVIGFSNMKHYTISKGRVRLAAGAPESAWRAVRRIKTRRREIPQKGLDPIVEITTEIELWSKDAQLRNLGEFRAMFKENRAKESDAMTDAGDAAELSPEERKARVISLLAEARKRREAVKGTNGNGTHG